MIIELLVGFWALPLLARLTILALILWVLCAGLGWLVSRLTGWRLRRIVVGLWVLCLTPILVGEWRAQSDARAMAAVNFWPEELDVTGGVTQIVGGSAFLASFDSIPALLVHASPSSIVLQVDLSYPPNREQVVSEHWIDVLTSPARLDHSIVRRLLPGARGFLGPTADTEEPTEAMRLAVPDRVILLDNGATITKLIPERLGLTPEIAERADIAIYVLEGGELTVRMLFATRNSFSFFLHGDAFAPQPQDAIGAWQAGLCGYDRPMSFDIYCPVSFLSLIQAN